MVEIEQSEQCGDVGGLSGHQAHSQSHIYCIHWFITSHAALYNPRLRKGRGAQREEKDAMGDMTEEKQPLCDGPLK